MGPAEEGHQSHSRGAGHTSNTLQKREGGGGGGGGVPHIAGQLELMCRWPSRTVLEPQRDSPVLAAKGPRARAKAPSDRKIPITLPFSSPSPNRDTMVVRLGTIVPAPAGGGAYEGCDLCEQRVTSER